MVVAAGSAIAGAATGAIAGLPVAAVAGATSAATGAVSAKITGGNVAPSAAVGAAAGAAVSVATTAAVGAVTGIAGVIGTAAAVASGPIGWLVLGGDICMASWDCWKPVVHDISCTASNGCFLRDILMDSKVKEVEVLEMSHVAPEMPQLLVLNIWDETFCIDYVKLPCGLLAAHASKMDNLDRG